MSTQYLTICTLFLISILLLSCKQECTYNCSDRSDCVTGECVCDVENMYRILSGTDERANTVRCYPPNMFEGAFTYRPVGSRPCLCAEDIVLYFYHCRDNTGGLVGSCSAHILYKDTSVNMYRNNTLINTAFFPGNGGGEDREVFVEWGDRTAGKFPFCRDREGLGGVIFRGEASESLDTLEMNLVYYNPDWFVDRDSCAVTFVRVKEEDR